MSQTNSTADSKMLLKIIKEISSYIDEFEILMEQQPEDIPNSNILIQKLREILKSGGITGLSKNKKTNGVDNDLDSEETTETEDSTKKSESQEDVKYVPEMNEQKTTLPGQISKFTRSSPLRSAVKGQPATSPVKVQQNSINEEDEEEPPVEEEIGHNMEEEGGPPKKKIAFSRPEIGRPRRFQATGQRLASNGPTRSPYAIFYDLCLDALKKQHAGLKIHINLPRFSRQCGEKWRAMTEIDKRSFRALAKQEKEQYEEEMMMNPEIKPTKIKPVKVVKSETTNGSSNGVTRRTTKKTSKINGHIRNVSSRVGRRPSIPKRYLREDPEILNSSKNKSGRRRANAYSHEELQTVLDYVCESLKQGQTGLLKMWEEAKESGKFPGRTADALQQQFRKTIIPNLDNYVISEENKQILLSSRAGRRGHFAQTATDEMQDESDFEMAEEN